MQAITFQAKYIANTHKTSNPAPMLFCEHIYSKIFITFFWEHNHGCVGSDWLSEVNGSLNQQKLHLSILHPQMFPYHNHHAIPLSPVSVMPNPYCQQLCCSPVAYPVFARARCRRQRLFWCYAHICWPSTSFTFTNCPIIEILSGQRPDFTCMLT